MRREERWSPAVQLLGSGPGSAAVRQAPTAVLTAVSAVVVAIAPGSYVTGGIETVAGLAVVALATVAAGVIGRRGAESPWLLVIPAASELGLGTFRLGTGGATSLFAPLLLVPMVWMATTPRRGGVVLAIGSGVTAFWLPALAALAGWSSIGLDQPGRSLYGPTVVVLLSVVLHTLARQLRRQFVDLLDSRERLAVAEAFGRSVLAAVTEQAVVGTDLAGRIELWNPGAEAMLGLSRGEVLGRALTTLHTDEEIVERVAATTRDGRVPSAFDAVVGRAAAGEPEVREWTWVRGDGVTVPVETTTTVRSAPDGRPAGYIVVGEDMTRAHESARVKDEFVGLVSHELRTPVSSILGYAELLRDEPLTADQEHDLGVVERNARRLLRLVGDLLFTAQVEGGRFSLVRGEVRVLEVVAAALETAAPAVERAQVSLRRVIDDDAGDPVVAADAERLGQALDNLVANAVKFTPPGGTVTIGVAADDEVVRIAVSDTGIGIPAAELDRLFGRFFRASTATRHAVAGVGLGLTITRAIAEAHDGSVEVTSREGEGSTFTLVLPLLAGAVPPELPLGARGVSEAS